MLLRRPFYVGFRAALFVALASILLCVRPAAAQLSLILMPETRTTAGGVSVLYDAQLENEDSTGPLFLNGISFDLTGDAARFLIADDAPFAELPDFLTPVGTEGFRYSSPLFSVLPSIATPPGTYSGTLTVTGGANETENIPLRTVTFTVITTPGEIGREAPEPASIMLILFVLPALRAGKTNLLLASKPRKAL